MPPDYTRGRRGVHEFELLPSSLWWLEMPSYSTHLPEPTSRSGRLRRFHARLEEAGAEGRTTSGAFIGRAVVAS